MALLILAFTITFISPWTWRLFKDGNYLALVEIVALTVILFASLKKPKVMLLALLFIPLSIPTIFSFKPAELFMLNERRSEYPNALMGKMFENKITQYFYHYQTNLFYNLDLNYYFFASHPRERAGYSEFNRLSLWLLPFFLGGLYWQVTHRKYQLLVYFFSALLIISFFSGDQYSFLLLPFFSLSSALCIKYFSA